MDIISKVLLAIAGLLTLVVGAVIYIVLFEGVPPSVEAANQAVVATPSQGTACDASSLSGTVCPDNYYCRFDTCVPVEVEKTCTEGESCRGCACAEGLVCHQFRCADPARVDRTPLVCKRNKRLADAVQQLVDKCKERKKDLNDIVSTGSCSAKDWEHLALEDDKFDLLLAAFPNRFAVHFQIGKPPLKGRDWPSKVVHDHYLEQIKRFQAPLRDAKQIFVIGRASPDGSIKTNYDLSLKRMSLVSQWIEDVIYEGKTETERSAHRVRIRSFTLPTAEPIQPSRYQATYLNDPVGSSSLELEPLITWDSASFDALQNALADPGVRDAEGTRAWQELYGEINRVVLVIPIPCTGTEYNEKDTDLALTKEAAG